jgi:PIN domain nuclease of toxin-antitoxin system
VKILIDTHVLLWLATEPERISAVALEELEKDWNEILVSDATAWELQIKHQAGRLDLPKDPEFFFRECLEFYRLTTVAIDLKSIWRLGKLPLIHRDPFDRLLVAQAIHWGVPLVSADEEMKRYPVDVIEA